MIRSISIKWMLLLAFSVAVAGTTTHAADQSRSSGSQTVSPLQSQARDVILGEDGSLTGQIVSPAGTGIGNLTVCVVDKAKLVGSAKTKEDGTFQIAGLQGGTFLITAQDTQSLVRLWPAGTAPPLAVEGALLVTRRATVRGSFGGISDGILRMNETSAVMAIPLLLGGAGVIQHLRQEEGS